MQVADRSAASGVSGRFHDTIHFVEGRMLEETRPSVSFRRAEASEAGAIRELVVRSMGHWEHAPAYLQEARELVSLSAEDLERDEAWVAMVGGNVVGFYRLSRAGENAEIEEFHLEPALIGGGIGRAMFEHAVRQGRSIGARWLTWTTEANALGFYLHMGGEVTGMEASGIAGEEPLTCMRLDLRPR
jgi:GNAT superfamily N-acetyltransferase